MRVLHVIQRYWPYVGGSERQFQEFSERLVRDGHQVTVFTTDAWDLDLFWARNRRRIDVPAEEHGGVMIRRFPVHHIAPTDSPTLPYAAPCWRCLVFRSTLLGCCFRWRTLRRGCLS